MVDRIDYVAKYNASLEQVNLSLQSSAPGTYLLDSGVVNELRSVLVRNFATLYAYRQALKHTGRWDRQTPIHREYINTRDTVRSRVAELWDQFDISKGRPPKAINHSPVSDSSDDEE